MPESLLNEIRESGAGLVQTVVAFLPQIFAAVAILVVGYVLARVMRALTARTLPAVDRLWDRQEVIERMDRFRYADLPVLDYHGKLVGLIHPDRLVEAVQEESTADIQTMFGASKDERALSKITFAVRKRLPWLEINLATAFLAASVVGLFEGNIARFTALAVTMRGLALREIGTRHLFRVVFKEANVGLMNGLAIALTTSLGVYIWSRSGGLALVIGTSMAISMVAAGLAGATIPIMLTKLGQDPAQSSSIILTTVTDVAGFLSFLGIATLLSGLL